MSGPTDLDPLKRAAAEAAIGEVEPGMVVGLGTGSTAAQAIALLAARVAQGLDVRAVATSRRTAEAALAAGIALLPLDGLTAIDLCIDGVDEIDPAFRAIKGGGGAMLIEKIVASMARRNVAIADASKAVERLGARPVPIEVLPQAAAFVAAQVAALGATAKLRREKGVPVASDSGHAILDCQFEVIADPADLAQALAATPGALGHGLFVTEIDALYLAGAEGVAYRERPVAPDG